MVRLPAYSKRGHSAAAALLVAAAACVFLPGCFKLNVNVPSFGSPDRIDGDGSPSGWQGTAIDVASKMTLAAEYGTVFYAFDALALPGESVELVARVLSVRKMSAARNVTVEFTRGADRLDLVQTDKDGYARLKWKAERPGDYEFAAKIVAVPADEIAEMKKVSPAPLLVCVRPKDARFAVIDLDHTVVASSFARVIFGGARPMPRAAEVVTEFRRQYSIIYLTHRPDLLAAKSKRWLTDNGFPRAPLLVSTLQEAFGDSGKYKSATLKQLRRRFSRLEIGIGDKPSDTRAYVDNNMTAYLLPHYDRDDDDADDLRDLAKDLRKFGRTVQIVDNWDEIRAGVFGKQRFTPQAYARRLDDRAGQIERKKRRKKNDDDDD